ncbi:MAG: hypothetical protein RL685_78 [Pseudomonadota bacterium]|jgi:hypothetical protein
MTHPPPSTPPSLRPSGIFIKSDESEGSLRVTLSGNGDASAVQPLDDYLVQLHGQLAQSKASAVLIDVTQLVFMNSSCIKAFASWIHDVKVSASPYMIRLRLNPGLLWQKRTLKTLTRLAPSVVQLEEVSL